MEGPKLVLTAKEASKTANVSYPTMQKWLHRADFPAFRIGKKWLIPAKGFAAWLERQAGGNQHDQPD